MLNKRARLGPVTATISVLGSLLLIGMGIVFSFDHTGAAAAYEFPCRAGAKTPGSVPPLFGTWRLDVLLSPSLFFAIAVRWVLVSSLVHYPHRRRHCRARK